MANMQAAHVREKARLLFLSLKLLKKRIANAKED